MPEPLTSTQLENATKMAAKVVETFGDDWDLHYIDDSEVSCRTDYDNPFEGSYVEVFTTSQWPEGKDHSPVAEFLCASIVMVPRLVGEVERLNARVAELTALLNDPDRLALHALELRAIYAEADADAERDRLADGGEL
ncbi:hypothetical protein ABZ917_17835 [Nonomuraea wenchangensis]